ncbi:MAG: anion permease [Acidobacteria bacterium]|nr:anion permease [Acidobacteriota bacterium]MBU1338568.1 anion permease [Acidobacteriota bacterium]MBU1474296.1 anion permease [Acidobacteriota bacterium]MBU2439271.1 anion permease [Acidobacteriota bacterium]
MEIRKKTGFVLGPLLFFLILLSPLLQDNPRAHNLLAVFSLVVIFWVTECVPIPITALLIPVFLTLFQVTSVKEAFAPFADPIIMLFLGGFILARAMCVHSLDQKLANAVLTSKIVAHKSGRILFGIGLITLVLSLWISNTATTAMMYPIALGMVGSLRAQTTRKKGITPESLFLLSVAYAASIGGIILIPMYLFLFSYIHMKMKKAGIPAVTDPGIFDHIRETKRLSRAQINVLIAFTFTVILWVLPGLAALALGREASSTVWLRNHFPEAVAAILGAGLLFFLPVDWKKGRFTLTLKEGLNIDWGTLLLFGGGLSLGIQMFDAGLADQIGLLFLSLGGESAGLGLICLLSITLTVFLTELTSNTASANMVIPIIIAVSQAAQINPLPPVIGSAIGCSFAFMLPVATPPNAIVFGSGIIRLPDMMKTGLVLNIAGILLIWLGVTQIAPLFGLFG